MEATLEPSGILRLASFQLVLQGSVTLFVVLQTQSVRTRLTLALKENREGMAVLAFILVSGGFVMLATGEEGFQPLSPTRIVQKSFGNLQMEVLWGGWRSWEKREMGPQTLVLQAFLFPPLSFEKEKCIKSSHSVACRGLTLTNLKKTTKDWFGGIEMANSQKEKQV